MLSYGLCFPKFCPSRLVQDPGCESSGAARPARSRTGALALEAQKAIERARVEAERRRMMERSTQPEEEDDEASVPLEA